MSSKTEELAQHLLSKHSHEELANFLALERGQRALEFGKGLRGSDPDPSLYDEYANSSHIAQTYQEWLESHLKASRLSAAKYGAEAETANLKHLLAEKQIGWYEAALEQLQAMNISPAGRRLVQLALNKYAEKSADGGGK